jgi:hypothetical protein
MIQRALWPPRPPPFARDVCPTCSDSPSPPRRTDSFRLPRPTPSCWGASIHLPRLTPLCWVLPSAIVAASTVLVRRAARAMLHWKRMFQRNVVNILGLSPIYTLQLAAKFGFQPRTSKPDNFGPPTLEKVQLSSFWAVSCVNSNFWYFREHQNFILFFRAS